MFWLPVIEAPHWRLPFTLTATIGLANAWLASTPGERQLRMSGVLADEPGMVLWILAGVSEFRGDAPQGGIAELAEWLLAHGQSTLCSAFVHDERSGVRPTTFRDRVARRSPPLDRETAEHFGELAVRATARRRRLTDVRSVASASISNAAWWGFWLADAAQWCQHDDQALEHRRRGRAAADVSNESDSPDCLPSWLAESLGRVVSEPDDWPPLDEAARLRARWRVTSDEFVDLESLFAWMAGRIPSEAAYAERLEREKLAALRELAYGASHEINNPLANIATRAQALLRDERDPERQRSLAVIAGQAFRAHDMIADMMFVAKPPPLSLARIDLAAQLARLASEWMERADRQSTRLSYQASTETPLMAVVDEHAIGLAVGALVANALDALGTGGRIVVDLARARRPDLAVDQEAFQAAQDVGIAVTRELDGIEITVRDDGPGIPPDVRRHLFDPYFSGREAGRGLGFGLCKARRIAADHGGLLTVASESGRGATFTLWIPSSPNPLTET